MGRAERAAGQPDPVGAITKASALKISSTSGEAWRHKAAVQQGAAQRAAWEASPRGQERTRDAVAMEADHPVKGWTHAQIYYEKGWGQSQVGARHNEPNLPGMEHPDAVATPPRWEDLPHEEQQATHRALAERGTSIDQMGNDFGAQLDQSYERASRHGSDPHAQHFYTTDAPARVIRDSAAALGIPAGVHVAMNAFTSPQTKFQQGNRFPNNETAVSVVKQVQAGVPKEDVVPGFRDPMEIHTTGPDKGKPKKNQGYPANTRKAADALEQHLAGVPIQDWKGRIKENRRTGGVDPIPEAEQKPMFGPKTGPYHNSWLLSHPDFFVADVHSGGGGMVPHLSSDKPVLRKEDGRQFSNKSGREEAIERVPNFHSAADFAARQALSKRGLGSIRQGQAAQWGEEQLQRTEINSKTAMAKAADVFPSRPQDHPGQGSLF